MTHTDPDAGTREQDIVDEICDLRIAFLKCKNNFPERVYLGKAEMKRLGESMEHFGFEKDSSPLLVMGLKVFSVDAETHMFIA